MDDGFPKFPLKYQYVKFEKDWTFTSSKRTYASTSATAYLISDQVIPTGTIGQIVDTIIVDGYDHDVADGYLLHIAVLVNDHPVILKFPYTDRPDVISVIPDTPAGRVLFGKKNEP